MKEISTDRKILTNAGIVFLLAALLLASSTIAQSGGPYLLEWSTIDGGGGRSSGGPYILTGTIGQPDAGAMANGNYEVFGGFWVGGELCFVGFRHFARFAQYWLDNDCNAGNAWCGGADLDYLDGVNWWDLRLFSDEWLMSCPYGWPLK